MGNTQTVSCDELTDRNPRTLIYGYTRLDRCRFHVYLSSRNTFEAVIYRDMGTYWFPWFSDRFTVVVELCVPDGRVFPQYSDREFCELLHSKGIKIDFAPWSDPDEERLAAKFVGRTKSDLEGDW